MIRFKIKSQGDRLSVTSHNGVPDCEIFLMSEGDGVNRYITVCMYHANGAGYNKLLRIKPNGFAYRCTDIPEDFGFKIDEEGKLRFSQVPFCGEA